MKSKTALFLVLLFFYACDEIGIPNIEADEVQLISPPDKHEAVSQVFKFWWEALDDADNYRLIIVQPSFEQPEDLIVDTTITGLQFALTLSEGDYQWTVEGINAEYESLRIIRDLRVASNDNSNLANLEVLLQEPIADDCQRQSIIEFEWDIVPNADQYILQISLNDFTGLLLNTTLTSPNYLYNVIADDTYQWRVRAENLNSLTFTSWSNRSFRVDRTSPSAPTLNFPNSNDTIIIANQNPDLSWTFASDTVEDILVIYADSNKDTILLQTTLTDNFLNLEEGSPDFQPTVIEDYYWEVFSKDACGNTSDVSMLGIFFIQP